MYELLTPLQMATADELTIRDGTPGIELMKNAGNAVARIVKEHFPSARNILVVCGTGNNAGDGFVAANHLSDEGLKVQVLICGDASKISGDAKEAFTGMKPSLIAQTIPDLSNIDLVIDALLGAGLDREIGGELAEMVTKINHSNKPIVSVDLPSGIDGRTGKVMGSAIHADHTVTFFRYKPGHMLMPGRYFCGNCHLHQIGIQETVLKKTGITGYQNRPEGWSKKFKLPSIEAHKYDRGHTLVVSGPSSATGAARLTAQAALRSGSGLVTIASPREALAINAAHLTSVMLQEADNPDEICKILEDPRLNCVALGPGLPPTTKTACTVEKVLGMNRRTILDAGALTAFSDIPERVFEKIHHCENDVFLTPHDGEFTRLFPGESILPSKIDRAVAASTKSGATIILKGPDTIVAAPDGQVSVSDNAPPWLSTAGSGDVLTGIIAGLAAQKMDAFEAACAATWFHGEAANRMGPGLISSDLDEGLRQALNCFILQERNLA